MHGNTGGSSFIFIGGQQSPEGVAGAMALLAIGAAVFGVVYAFDVPDRHTETDAILSQSVAHCANVTEDEAAYTDKLQSKLMGVWSSTLETVTANEDLVVCVDDGLNGFVMPYDYNDSVKRIWGEHRVVAAFYTSPYGQQALVVKPDSNIIPENAIDHEPDTPLSLSKVLEQFNARQSNVYSEALPDGTVVSALIQRDGVTQEFGSSRIPDDDGKGWANAEVLEEIKTHYDFQWPLVRSTGRSYDPN